LALPKFEGDSHGGGVGEAVAGNPSAGLPEWFQPNFWRAHQCGLQMGFYGVGCQWINETTSGIAKSGYRARSLRLGEEVGDSGRLDTPFFSPTPRHVYVCGGAGFRSAGMVAGTPTVRVEQAIRRGGSPFKLEAGLLDPSAKHQLHNEQQFACGLDRQKGKLGIPTCCDALFVINRIGGAVRYLRS